MKKLILFISLILLSFISSYSQESEVLSKTYFSVHRELTNPYYNLISILNVPDSLRLDSIGIEVQISSEVKRRSSIFVEYSDASVSTISSASDKITLYPQPGFNEKGDREVKVVYSSETPTHKVCYIPSSKISFDVIRICFKSLVVENSYLERNFITVSIKSDYYGTSWIFMNNELSDETIVVAPVDGGTVDCYY